MELAESLDYALHKVTCLCVEQVVMYMFTVACDVLVWIVDLFCLQAVLHGDRGLRFQG